mmetsp:Transcript_8978/g.17509  ORF Transcript_8978/g.17509 Transcript_8978/m.17509 type:complete len:212 (+) Transcript_8978:535-1170(+)
MTVEKRPRQGGVSLVRLRVDVRFPILDEVLDDLDVALLGRHDQERFAMEVLPLHVAADVDVRRFPVTHLVVAAGEILIVGVDSFAASSAFLAAGTQKVLDHLQAPLGGSPGQSRVPPVVLRVDVGVAVLCQVSHNRDVPRHSRQDESGLPLHIRRLNVRLGLDKPLDDGDMTVPRGPCQCAVALLVPGLENSLQQLGVRRRRRRSGRALEL